MAAGDSPTGIANIALAMLGEDPIANVAPPDANKRGRLCAQFYDSSRRAMLEAAPWRCAKRPFQGLAATLPAGVLPARYGAAYPVPQDFIRLYNVHGEGERWQLMNIASVGLCVITPAGAPLDEEYIFDLDDPVPMQALLVKAIAADMANMMALPLTRDMTLKNTVAAERDAYLSLARSISAQQASPERWDTDSLLRSRW